MRISAKAIEKDVDPALLEGRIKYTVDSVAAQLTGDYPLPIDCLYAATGDARVRSISEPFKNLLKIQMRLNPTANYLPFAVIIQTNKSKAEVLQFINRQKYMVIGGNHSFLATKELHEENPQNPFYGSRSCKIFYNPAPETIKEVPLISFFPFIFLFSPTQPNKQQTDCQQAQCGCRNKERLQLL